MKSYPIYSEDVDGEISYHVNIGGLPETPVLEFFVKQMYEFNRILNLAYATKHENGILYCIERIESYLSFLDYLGLDYGEAIINVGFELDE